MTGPSHIAFAAAATLGLAHFTHDPPTVLGWFALLTGSLAPDIDSRSSTITKPGTIFKRFLPKFLVEVLNTLGAMTSFSVRLVSSHRGASHWPSLGLSILFLGAANALDWVAWFGWGYCTHILADFCTKGGVPLWGPLSRKAVSWSPLRSGSIAERCLMLLLWVYVCYAGYQYLPQETQFWLQNYWEGLQKLAGAALAAYWLSDFGKS